MATTNKSALAFRASFRGGPGLSPSKRESPKDPKEKPLSLKSDIKAIAILLFLIGHFTALDIADALVPKQDDGFLESLIFVSEVLQARPQSKSYDDVRMTVDQGIADTWNGFRVRHGNWNAMIDKRTGKIESAEGQGIPFVPGHGNQLRIIDMFPNAVEHQEIDLAAMEALTRAFLPQVASLLGVDHSTLVLNQGGSGHPAAYLWFVDFDVTLDGMVVEGARVVFRVNNGNLIQFGSENLPAEGTKVPEAKVTRAQALTILADYVGGFSAADTFVDGGSQSFIPMAVADNRLADGFQVGRGRGVARIWQFVFRRHGDYGTWRARIDATSGKILEFSDLNSYASAQVSGGVKSFTGSETRPMSFTDVSGGYTNSAGVYTYISGTVKSSLNGQYVKINDKCGEISVASGSTGNLDFGTSGGTDCETPGFGPAGNTNSSRTQFYNLNRAKEIARGWLNLPWLTVPLIANVNLDGPCNASWDETTVNFARSEPDCSNTGEIAAVGLHEYGHGLDANDGSGSSPDKGTGETYGDWTATLITHDSCIGTGLRLSNCNGYGDACTSCTGVRDIDYTKHSSGIPHTVDNFTKYCPDGQNYTGPCGTEEHCESQVSSEALWDAARELLNEDTASAWAIMDRLWYLSRPTATAAFSCDPETSPWTSDGCNANSLWKTMRAVDDDDGNLSNGTPHSAALYRAFDRHGIACPEDVGASTSFHGCTQPAVPSISLAAGNNQVTVSWLGSTGVYDIYRNEQGCNAGGFIKVANDLTNSSFTDSNVSHNFAYSYQVAAQPIGNEACSSAPSQCLEVTPHPCPSLGAPSNVTLTRNIANQVNLSWTASSGADHYNIYRAITSDGPYIRVGTSTGTAFSDTGLSYCETYYYIVHTASNNACESDNSNPVSASSTVTCSLLTVLKDGSGTGTVTSSPSGVNCGTDCREAFLYNEWVELTATPTAGMFNGWSGACTGAGRCMIVMTQARTVTASFSDTYTLDVSHNGGGIVTSVPTGISCGGDCSENYTINTTVTLTATPEVGYVFTGWGGACQGTGQCVVSMTQVRRVTAFFFRPVLSVYLINEYGGEVGTVTSTPSGINCGTLCSRAYNYGTQVTLTAIPPAGTVISGWSGDCFSGSSPTCTVAMTRDYYIRVYFAPLELILRVYRDGAGSGTIISTPTGINCGVDCSETYTDNTSVMLTATPAIGSVFAGWAGGCHGTGTCEVTITGSHWARATFSLPFTLTVGLTGSGNGTVTSTPSGINCGADCSEEYVDGTQVTLSATAAAGSVFVGWTGACAGMVTCTVTMSEARSVVAMFSVSDTLTVSLAGTGSGIVASTPPGIYCGAYCSSAYLHNTSVALMATPAPGSVFDGWGGECTGTGTCTLTISQAHAVTATFSLSTYTLTTSLAGAGSGTVSSMPAGINCGADCSEAYNYSTQVTLTATPAAGSVFGGWTGACSGTGTCTATMSQARSVTATFSVATYYSLTVNLAGPGSGIVTSTPIGINCGADCSEAYNDNTQVTLTATPAAGSVFDGWTGVCAGTGTCIVSMSQARSVTATFSVGTYYSLAVNLAGLGGGMVTSTPAGIDCGADCSEIFLQNTSVTLTATPATGQVFSGWSGACTGTGTCTVTMTQARSVTATFLKRYLLSVSYFGFGGGGKVTSVPTGINCGSTCGAYYPDAATVTLTAIPDEGILFDSWLGDCGGKVASCTVTMTQARSVRAIFQIPVLNVFLVNEYGGSGTVTSTPGIINCGSQCSWGYKLNTQVTLTATPAPGSVFTKWSGACTGTDTTCTVDITDASPRAYAWFAGPNYPLTVSLAGVSSSVGGYVLSTPMGIHCASDCSENYSYNTLVTLTATPWPGSVFGWSGACTGTDVCTVMMSQVRSVIATFSKQTPGQDFYTILPPCRVFDSRITGPRLTSENPVIINVAGSCGVPATAKAVSLNVTAIGAPGDGFITLYPGDIALPGTWTIGFLASLNRANNAVIPLAWNGNGTLAAVAVITGGGTMDMILDVNGYFE
jgi:hypothetical protein